MGKGRTAAKKVEEYQDKRNIRITHESYIYDMYAKLSFCDADKLLEVMNNMGIENKKVIGDTKFTPPIFKDKKQGDVLLDISINVRDCRANNIYYYSKEGEVLAARLEDLISYKGPLITVNSHLRIRN